MEIHQDKIRHFVTALLIAAGLYLASRSTFTAIAGTLALGWAKELVDLRRHRNTLPESMVDMVANAIGIAVGLLVSRYALLPWLR